MPEALWNVLAIIGLGCVVLTLLLAVWLVVIGEVDVTVGWPDDDATLDVQNHQGDTRPVQ